MKSNSQFNRLVTALLLIAMMSGSVLSAPGIYAASNTNATTAGKSAIGLEQTPPLPGQTNVTFESRLGEAKGRVAVMIELQDVPAAIVYAGAKEADTKLTTNQLASVTRAQKAKIETAQQRVLAALNSNPKLGVQVIYRVQNALNGVAVLIDAANAKELMGLPGVKAINQITTHERDNAVSGPLIGGPQVWASFGVTGTNVKLGIIDTGIDYLHTNFGGPGTYTGYNDTIIGDTPGIFPGGKVFGGYDFAGNAYDASNAPVPDPDPIDCSSALGGGHGSHVAGTAGGLGVNADGTTYRGPYNTSINFNNMRIGPGLAPGSQLYALRVFGCTGSTNLVEVAIDYALDPNDDGSFADRLDVVNMSLGSSYGTADDTSARATNNAAAAGILFTVSAGNSGDVHYISGSPGSATRALTVASSVDSTDIADGFRINGPSPIAGVYGAFISANYPWNNPPAANPIPVTQTIYYSAVNPTGCTTYNASDTALIAGKIVLQDWNPLNLPSFPCGSVARTGNAFAAGAKGVIIVYNLTSIDIAISGSTQIPAVITTKTTGDLIKTQLTPGAPSNVSATLTAEYNSAGKLVDPSRTDNVSTFTSRGPRVGDNLLKPDISAPGQSIFSTNSGTGNLGESLNGTSMAAPQMAGVTALLRQKNPTWSVEEIKALAMNTAAHDLFQGPSLTGNRYSPSRVGAGRADAALAVSNTVLLYNTDAPGGVNVSFGLAEIAGTSSYTKTVQVVNKGTTSASYTISYDAINVVPGVNYSFPAGNNLTVAANTTSTFQIVLTGNASQMKHVLDKTESATTLVGDRQWLTEAAGLIKLTPTGPGGQGLRLPVMAIVRPASTLSPASSTLNFGSPTATSTITLNGQGVNTGSSYPTDTVSLVTALELQGVSPMIALNPPSVTERFRAMDIKYVGVSTDSKARVGAGQPIDNSLVYFGISTYGNWTRPAAELEFDVYIDTNRDGTDDVVLFNTSEVAGADATDVFVVKMFNLATSTLTTVSDLNTFKATLDTAIFNNNVIVMSVPAAALNMGANTKFDYSVITFERFTEVGSIDEAGPFTYDYANPGLNFSTVPNISGVITGATTYQSAQGTNIPVSFNQANYDANGSQGVLLFQHFNTEGNRAQVMSITTTPACNAFMVTSSIDDGACGSLRFAITQANSMISSQGLTITISGTTSIQVNSPLPVMTNTTTNTLAIVGSCTTAMVGGVMRSTPGVRLSPSSSFVNSGDGMKITNNTTISGFSITGFGANGINIEGNNNTITCSRVGTTDGTAAIGNGSGIQIAGNNNNIGRAGDVASGNLISGNTGVGVRVLSGTNNDLYYNWIGYAADGVTGLSNTGGAVSVARGAQVKFGLGNRIRF